jgi:hypothetical protein
MAKLVLLTMGLHSGTTDARMHAYKLGYTHLIQVKDYTRFCQMRDSAANLFGEAYQTFYQPYWRMYECEQQRWGSHFDSIRHGTGERHRLYFRSRHDMESVLTLYALQHGTLE